MTSLELPAPLTARVPAPGDAGRIAAMLVRSDVADRGKPDTDEDDVSLVWRWPGFDVERDALVAVAPDGAVAGYAWAHKGREGDVAVDPAWRGRGLGRALLGWADRRALAQADPPEALELAAWHRNAAAAKLLAGAGFEPSGATLHMGIELESPPPAAPLPAGVALRGVDADRDGKALHALVNASFRGQPWWTERPFGEWEQFTLRRRAFDPGLALVATAGGEDVGMVLCHRYDDEGEGFVQYLAVVPAWRRRGLGLALLGRAFEAIAGRGLASATLYVNAANPTGAARLYERAGMRMIGRYDHWKRPAPA